MAKGTIDNKLKSYVANRVRNFSYLGITSEEIFSFLNAEIKSDEDIDLESIKEKINEFIVNQGEKKLLDEQQASEIIKAYIIKCFKKQRTIVGALENLEKLSFFFIQYNYLPNPDMMMEIIKENKRLRENVEMVFNEYQKKFLSGNGDEIFEDTNILFIIDSYCMVKHIDKKLNLESSVEEETANILAIYFREIGRYPLLTKEEEVSLAYRMKEGDVKAKEKLIESNLRLVVSVAKGFRYKGLEFADLIQEGNVGLLIAVDKFDVEKGYQFSTYAIWWIKQAIIRSLHNKGKDIRIPVWQNERLSTYKKIQSQLKLALNREPTIEEIATKMGISIVEAKELQKLILDTISLNAIIDHDSETELEDFLSVDEESIEDFSILSMLPQQIDHLFDQAKLKLREKTIIVLRYGLNDGKKWTLREIGERYHVSDERVRQLELAGLRKLRKFNGIKSFVNYTENPSQSLENIEKFKELYKDPKNRTKTLLKVKKTTSHKSEPKRWKTIYQLLEPYSKEEIEQLLATLSESDKDLINLRYGCDWQHPIKTRLTREESARFYHDLIPRLKSELCSQSKNKKVAKEQEPTDNKSNGLSNGERPINIKEESTNIEEITPLEEPVDIEKQDDKKISDFLNLSIFQQMVSTLSPKEAVIVSLKLGYVDGKCFSTEAIANFLGIEKEEVLETVKKALLLYKENINQFIDGAIESVDEQPKTLEKRLK